MLKVNEKKEYGNLIKKVGLSLVAFLLVPVVTNAQVELSDDIDTTVTYTEDVVLTKDITIKEGAKIVAKGNITIDLGGYTITKEGENNLKHANYAIDIAKNSDVTLKNGNITCASTTDSCIRNYSKLTITDLNVTADFTAIKIEEASTATITNSSITSSKSNAGTIMNYGTTTVSDSNITNKDGVAVFSLTYKDYSSKITVNNSIINARRAVETYYDDGVSAPTKDTTTNEVIINGGEIKGKGEIALREVPKSAAKPGTLTVSGNISAPLTVLEYTTNGTVLTVNANSVEGVEYNLPSGVKVIIPENIIVADTAIKTTDKDAITNFNDPADYTEVIKAKELYDKLDKSLYTEESVAALEAAVNKIVTGKKIGDQDLVNKMAEDINKAYKNLVKVEVKEPTPDNEPEKNPATGDNVGTYVSLLILSVGALGISTKKVLAN